MVRTVLGPVAPDALGRTLTHEHVVCDFYRVTGVLNHVLNDERLAVDELGLLREAGGTAVVDCSTPDMGRNVAGLARVSRASGVHVVSGCGWYRQPFYPSEVDRSTVDALAQVLVDELTVGIGGTGIRAGIIGEIGADLDYLTAQEERVLRASARASLATGAPIILHASMYPVGLVQLRVLQDEGVPLDRVVVGHADTFLDREYHACVLEQGAWLAFDTIARVHMNPDGRRADAFIELLAHGWASRLLLSSDRCHRSDLVAFGGPGYAATFAGFFPLLRTRGVDEATLDVLSIDNPRRLLAW